MEEKQAWDVIYYNTGENKGIKISIIENSIYMINMPWNKKRNQNVEANGINLLVNSVIYFLIDDENKKIYIGQSKNLKDRIQTHKTDSNKDNYNRILYFLSQLQFDPTTIDYLEYYFTDKWKNKQEEVIFKLQNKNNVKVLELDDARKLKLQKIIEKIEIFLNYEGFLIDKIDREKSDEIFYFENTEIIYYNNEFILLKGSKIVDRNSALKSTEKFVKTDKTWGETRINNLYNKLEIDSSENNETEGKYNDLKNGYWEIKENISFSSPSAIACLAKGTHSNNGWISFKNKKGKTLDDVFRK